MTGDQRVIPYISLKGWGWPTAHGPRRCTPDVEPAFPPSSSFHFFYQRGLLLYVVALHCRAIVQVHSRAYSSQRGLLLHSQLPYTCRVIVQVHSHAIGRARIKKERSFPDLPLTQAESGCLPGQTSRPMPVKEEEKECVRSFAIPPIPALLHGLFGGVGYC